MNLLKLSIACCLALATITFQSPIIAEEKGLPQLDEAVEKQLSAQTPEEMSKVIDLCKEALEKGLNEENTKFANRLLASSLVSRATRSQVEMSQMKPASPEDLQKLKSLRDEAIDDLVSAIKIQPKQSSTYYLLGRVYAIVREDRKKAMEAFSNSYENATDKSEKARALTARGILQTDPEKMLKDISAASELTPDSSEIFRTRGAVYLQMGQLKEAIEDLKKALELSPEHSPSRDMLVLALGRNKQLNEVEKVLEEGIKVHPESPKYDIQLARVYIGQKKIEEALQRINHALEIAPTNQEILFMRSATYQQLGETDKAMADLDAILEKHPHAEMVLRQKASLLMQLKKNKEAIKLIKDTLDEGKVETPLLYLLLGTLYGADKQFDEAVKNFDKVIEMAPDSSEGWRARANIYIEQGKHQAAIADYEKAAKINPQDPSVLNNLAWLLSTSPKDDLRDGKRAIELAKQACELTKYEQAHIVSTLAASYAEADDFEEAKKWAKKALESASDEFKEQIGDELKSYEEGKPWREVAPNR